MERPQEGLSGAVAGPSAVAPHAATKSVDSTPEGAATGLSSSVERKWMWKRMLLLLMVLSRMELGGRSGIAAALARGEACRR